ncbi:MAG: AlpA family transcriptional regulator [Treponema sp.]|nr:AlpA family transcriptional regulator [Treponema sp.]
MERPKEPPIRMDKVMELSGFSRSYIYKLVQLEKNTMPPAYPRTAFLLRKRSP